MMLARYILILYPLAATVSVELDQSPSRLQSPPASLVVVAPSPNETDSVVIQRCIDSGAAEVVIPMIDRPWVVDPLRLRNAMTLRLDPGVVLEARPGGFRKNTDSLFMGHEVKNVSIIGYGATIRMRKSDYTKSDYQRGEWRHGIDLKGSSDILIEGLSIENTGGDGVYIGPTWDARRIPCHKITLRNCTMDQNFRQGVSIVSGENIRITNCALSHTNGTNPQAGIDLEPGHYSDKLTDIVIQRCTAIGNTGSGFIVAIPRHDRRSSPVSVLFESCIARGSQSHLVQSNVGREPPTGKVIFRNCVFEDSPKAGLRGNWKSSPEKFALRFEDCKWSAVAGNYNRAPIALDLPPVDRFSEEGGIYFTNCYLFDDRPREVLDLGGAARCDVKGRLQVVNQHRPAPSGRSTTTQLTIEYVDSARSFDQDAGGATPGGK